MVSSGGLNTRPIAQHDDFEAMRHSVKKFKSQSRGKTWSHMCWKRHMMQAVRLTKPRQCSNCTEWMTELIEVGYCYVCNYWSCLSCMHSQDDLNKRVETQRTEQATQASSSTSWTQRSGKEWKSNPYGKWDPQMKWRKK